MSGNKSEKLEQILEPSNISSHPYRDFAAGFRPGKNPTREAREALAPASDIHTRQEIHSDMENFEEIYKTCQQFFQAEDTYRRFLNAQWSQLEQRTQDYKQQYELNIGQLEQRTQGHKQQYKVNMDQLNNQIENENKKYDNKLSGIKQQKEIQLRRYESKIKKLNKQEEQLLQRHQGKIASIDKQKGELSQQHQNEIASIDEQKEELSQQYQEEIASISKEGMHLLHQYQDIKILIYAQEARLQRRVTQIYKQLNPLLKQQRDNTKKMQDLGKLIPTNPLTPLDKLVKQVVQQHQEVIAQINKNIDPLVQQHQERISQINKNIDPLVQQHQERIAQVNEHIGQVLAWYEETTGKTALQKQFRETNEQFRNIQESMAILFGKDNQKWPEIERVIAERYSNILNKIYRERDRFITSGDSAKLKASLETFKKIIERIERELGWKHNNLKDDVKNNQYKIMNSQEKLKKFFQAKPNIWKKMEKHINQWNNDLSSKQIEYISKNDIEKLDGIYKDYASTLNKLKYQEVLREKDNLHRFIEQDAKFEESKKTFEKSHRELLGALGIDGRVIGETITEQYQEVIRKGPRPGERVKRYRSRTMPTETEQRYEYSLARLEELQILMEQDIQLEKAKRETKESSRELLAALGTDSEGIEQVITEQYREIIGEVSLQNRVQRYEQKNKDAENQEDYKNTTDRLKELQNLMKLEIWFVGAKKEFKSIDSELFDNFNDNLEINTHEHVSAKKLINEVDRYNKVEKYRNREIKQNYERNLTELADLLDQIRKDRVIRITNEQRIDNFSEFSDHWQSLQDSLRIIRMYLLQGSPSNITSIIKSEQQHLINHDTHNNRNQTPSEDQFKNLFEKPERSGRRDKSPDTVLKSLNAFGKFVQDYQKRLSAYQDILEGYQNDFLSFYEKSSKKRNIYDLSIEIVDDIDRYIKELSEEIKDTLSSRGFDNISNLTKENIREWNEKKPDYNMNYSVYMQEYLDKINRMVYSTFKKKRGKYETDFLKEIESGLSDLKSQLEDLRPGYGQN